MAHALADVKRGNFHGEILATDGHRWNTDFFWNKIEATNF
jgi:hypothetical protein